MLNISRRNCDSIWFTVTTFAFNISIEDNPPIFADVPLSWTRAEGDTDSFWFNELQIASDGSLLKILSLQVDGTSSSNGTMTFVFIRTGAHLIQAIDGNTNSAFFNSTNSITAVASNSSDSSSCTPVTSTVTASPTGSLNSASAHSNNSVVIGATIGTIVPLTIIAAVVVVLCIQRRARKWKDLSGSESPKPTEPNAFPSVFANLIGSRNSNGTITPFVAVPEPHTTSHSKFDPAMRTGSQTIGNPRTRSSFYAPPSSFGEKMLARPSVYAATAHVDDPGADQTQSSRSHISNAVDTGTPGATVPQLTQRQQLLEEEASRLRLQIMGMVNSALSSNQVPSEQNMQFENRQMAAEMERMRAQIEMLEHDRNSSWARGLSDEPPSYLTSIGR
ncbi:hypothetical protein F5890DRAFT_1486856 [Lentinula detonsa]|uniref:Mid2 domain-containing protein n=1 Tax=Lentinula detonsa TaxID=2804962 RepID=A0AA38Q9W8_9AGAR|nr:hypothetical protein F5890DRAFT_1486856 [Lentinula detonsa]